LVNNLMPGASDSHDNFLAVRGPNFRCTNLSTASPSWTTLSAIFSWRQPANFETVDLMTGGFTPEYGNRFGGVLDITRDPAPILADRRREFSRRHCG